MRFKAIPERLRSWTGSADAMLMWSVVEISLENIEKRRMITFFINSNRIFIGQVKMPSSGPLRFWHIISPSDMIRLFLVVLYRLVQWFHSDGS